MATVRSGSDCGPCSSPTSEGAAVAEETPDDKGNCDPDKLMQCPYDKNHMIRTCRFPYHLIKCRKNHPDLARELKTCPFNARHLLPAHQLSRHIQTCEDKISMEDELSNDRVKWQVPCTAWMSPHMTENWDSEVDENVAPFVWGISTDLTRGPDRRAINDLDVRAPSSLPWSVLKASGISQDGSTKQ